MMGAGLVMAAYGVAERIGLDHAPVRAFVYMAAVTLDTDERPTYWKGREALAHALGRSDANGHRAATRALEALDSAGAIARVGKHAPGRNARYALLDGQGTPLRVIHNMGRSASLEQHTTRDGERPMNTGRSAVEHGTVSGRTRDAHRPKEEEEEELGGIDRRACARDDDRSERFDLVRFRASRPDLVRLSDETVRRIAAETIGRARGSVRDETAYVLRAANTPEWLADAERTEWEVAVA